MVQLAKRVRHAFRRGSQIIRATMRVSFRNRTALPVYWWDDTANFGDMITEQILLWMGAPAVINVRNSLRDIGPALAGSGSLLQSLRYRSVVVWGCGFIQDVSERPPARRPVEVLALRGPRSKAVADRLGWVTPDVFGDPGVLLPLIYPAPAKRYEIGVVPHFGHASYFSGVETDERVRVIDVRQSVCAVAAEIAACNIVLSSSLHGLIVAHAYGIPWLWLRMEPELRGEDFKFGDFMEGMRIQAKSRQVKDGRAGYETLRGLAREAEYPREGDVKACQRVLLEALRQSDYYRLNGLRG